MASDIIGQHSQSFRAYCANFGCAVQGINLDASETESWRFERTVAWAACNRRLFRTKSEYYGLLHILICEGDVCCVFEGVRVPFVLRPVRDDRGGEEYNLVGDSYIHGVMKGEAIAMLKEGQFVKRVLL